MPPVKGADELEIVLTKYLCHHDVRFQPPDGFKGVCGVVCRTAYGQIGRSVEPFCDGQADNGERVNQEDPLDFALGILFICEFHIEHHQLHYMLQIMTEACLADYRFDMEIRLNRRAMLMSVAPQMEARKQFRR